MTKLDFFSNIITNKYSLVSIVILISEQKCIYKDQIAYKKVLSTKDTM